MKDVQRVPRNVVAPNDPIGLAALETGAAVVDRTGRGLLRLAGKDPAGMLGAILTNEVPEDENRGTYAMLLNPKGRVRTDLRVLKAGEGVLVDTEPEGVEAADEILGRYAPFSRVKLEDLSTSWSIFGLYGPRAGDLLGGLELAEHQSAETEIGGAKLLVVGVTTPVPGYDLIGPSDAVEAARDHLLSQGAIQVGPDVYETARIRAGVPRFGADITPENFPGETGLLDRAVSFRKGCYPGQETVARMHYRGHPNKTLHRLVFDGPPPAPGEDILQNGKAVGRVTSVAPLPTDNRTFALGYLSRNADTDGTLQAGEATILLGSKAASDLPT